MSLFMFYMPSLAQALKSCSIYEFILVLYAQIQFQHLNLAQYMSLDLFYMHCYSSSFKIWLNIRVQTCSICLILVHALKSSLLYELSIGLYAQYQFLLLNQAQYKCLVLFYIHSYSTNFEIQLNIRVQDYAICLALALALKSSSINEFILVLHAYLSLSFKIQLNI